jgi:hypothetical protein
MVQVRARSKFNEFASLVEGALLLPLLCIVWAAEPSAQGVPVTPQDQVDAASPGDIVVLPAGNHGTLTVTKALTLIGQPGSIFNQIVLSGAGGNLTLSNVRTLTDLTGQGFDQVRLSEVDVGGAVSVLGVRYLEINRSKLGVPLDNVNDIYAPGATVVLLDSTLIHGVGRVETERFFVSNTDPIQRLVASSSHGLTNDMALTGGMRPGQNFVLSWDTPGPLAVLYAATGTRPDPIAPQRYSGTWHLDNSYWPLFVVPQTGSMIVGLPPSGHLYGIELAFQAVTPRHFSRPVLSVVH